MHVGKQVRHISIYLLTIKKNKMKKENRGRKKIPSDEKKIPITVFCKKEKIDSIGGMESAKELIIETLNKIYETGK